MINKEFKKEYQEIKQKLKAGREYQTEWIGDKESFIFWLRNDVGISEVIGVKWKAETWGGVATAMILKPKWISPTNQPAPKTKRIVYKKNKL